MSGNQERGNITAESKKISDDFINIINKAFEIIDEVSDKIGDGNYLELANHFKSLHEFKNKLEGNIVYIEHERRTRMRLRPNQRRYTLAEKLKDKKKYMKCNKCDTVITRKEYHAHIGREKCKRIYCSKMLTVATKLRVLSEKLILLDDMLDKRDGYYYVNDGFDMRTRLMKIFTMRDYYETQIEVENKSAIKIQSLLRGYLCRKAIGNYKPKKENKKCVVITENKKEDENKLATKIQSLWRGRKIRKKVKIFDGTGKLPNYMNVDSWKIFRVMWKREGKIPIYRLSEYGRRVRNPTDDEKRQQRMFDIMRHRIHCRRRGKNSLVVRNKKWRNYRAMRNAKTKKDFTEWRKILCDIWVLKIKGVSKMSRSEIEMEVARQLWCK